MPNRSGRPTEESVSVSEAARVRLTPAERRGLDNLAFKIGATRARLLRRAVREMIGAGPDLFEDGLITLSEVTRELAAVGRNLNQLAAKLNSGDCAARPHSMRPDMRRIAMIATASTAMPVAAFPSSVPVSQFTAFEIAPEPDGSGVIDCACTCWLATIQSPVLSVDIAEAKTGFLALQSVFEGAGRAWVFMVGPPSRLQRW